MAELPNLSLLHCHFYLGTNELFFLHQILHELCYLILSQDVSYWLLLPPLPHIAVCVFSKVLKALISLLISLLSTMER